MLNAILDIFWPKVDVGVRCKLCGWTWRDPNVRDAFDTVNKTEANRLLRLHLKDRHPNLSEEQK